MPPPEKWLCACSTKTILRSKRPSGGRLAARKKRVEVEQFRMSADRMSLEHAPGMQSKGRKRIARPLFADVHLFITRKQQRHEKIHRLFLGSSCWQSPSGRRPKRRNNKVCFGNTHAPLQLFGRHRRLPRQEGAVPRPEELGRKPLRTGQRERLRLLLRNRPLAVSGLYARRMGRRKSRRPKPPPTPRSSHSGDTNTRRTTVPTAGAT